MPRSCRSRLRRALAPSGRAAWSLLVAVVIAAPVGAEPAPEPAPVPAPAPPVPAAAPPSPAAATPSTVEEAADEVLAARARHDADALRALAARDDPDPWLVADALLVRGKSEAADAFARAAPRKDVEALPGFVASRRANPIDRTARATLAAAVAAVGESKGARALGRLEAAKDAVDPIPAIRIAHVRGVALRAAKRHAESAAAFLAAGRQAVAIGWLARADETLDDAAAAGAEASDWKIALAASEERLVVAQARDREDVTAATLDRLAAIVAYVGDLPRALDVRRRTLAMRKRVGDRAGTAKSLVGIGDVLLQLGEAKAALPHFEEALALQDALGDRAGVAASLAAIGSVHHRLGDDDRALVVEEQALKLQEALGDRAGVARTLGTMGRLRSAVGDCEGALVFQGRALTLMEEMGDRAQVALTLGNIGAIHCSRRDFPRALEIQERALALKESLGDRRGVAETLQTIGVVQHSLGDFPKARSYLERAVALREDLGDRVGLAEALGDLGRVHEDLRDFPAALAAEQRALEIADRVAQQDLILRRAAALAKTQLARGDAAAALPLAHRAVELIGRLSAGLGEEQGAKAREQYARVFETGVRAAARVGDPAKGGDATETAYFLESGRGVTLLEALGGRDALRAFVIPDHLRMAEARARADEALAAQAHAISLAGGRFADIRATKLALRATQSRVGDVIERIQREAKAASSVVYPKADPLPVIQARLQPDEAMVLYGLFADVALALVLTPTDARVVDLGRPAEVSKAAEAEDWDALRARVLAPLGVGLDRGVRRLLVSPMGVLSVVPFCVLAPDREIVYVPSGTIYGVLLDEAKKRGKRVLALGDPEYAPHGDPVEGGSSRGGFPRLVPLPATRLEARAVGDVLLLGPDATVESLRGQVSVDTRWRSVHLACHGLIDFDRPKQSALALSNGESLKMMDVFRLQIRSDLVVLSACETARGKVYATEGVEGFVRAFLFAGAPRVLVSLWKVDDEATGALMARFYALWNPKDALPSVAPAEALLRAQQALREDPRWADPKFWAAWQLWGVAR